MTSANIHADKRKVWDYWQALDAAGSEAEIAALIQRHNHPDIEWNGPAPIDTLQGAEALARDLWLPLRRAFPALERRCDIFMGGHAFGRDWVSGTGYLVGRFERDWLGIPATGQEAFLRFGAFYEMQDGRIARAYVGLDVVDLARQAGLDLMTGYGGAAIRVPQRPDGILLDPQDEAASAESLALLERMGAGLNSFDGKDLKSVGSSATKSADYQWYGPAPLDYCDGLKEFEDFHQAPWLAAFPDRKSGDHKARFGEGRYVCCTGWPSVRMTHTGTYLGIPATGRALKLRCMDWFTRDGSKLTENRVWFDLIDLARQMGVDVMPAQTSAKEQSA